MPTTTATTGAAASSSGVRPSPAGHSHSHSHSRSNWTSSSNTPLVSPRLSQTATHPQSPPVRRHAQHTPQPLPAKSVGQTMPPQLTRAVTTDPRTPSPNYFGFVVDSTNNPPDSNPGMHTRRNWDFPSTTAATSRSHVDYETPGTVPVNADPAFAAFLKQSEKNAFNLSNSYFANATPVSERGPPRSEPESKAQKLRPESSKRRHDSAMTPYIVDDRPFKDAKDQNMSLGGQSRPDGSSLDAPSFFDVPALSKSPGQLSVTDKATLQQQTSAPDLKEEARQAKGPLSPPTAANSRAAASIGPGPPPMSLTLPRGRVGSLTSPPPRAGTLPATMDLSSPPFVPAQKVADILRAIPDEVLILDLRVYPQYSSSRLRGALNLCIPTTLLKRPSFDLQKLLDTFAGEEERRKFEGWQSCKWIIAYDASSTQHKDAGSSVHILKKFTGSSESKSWKGQVGILRGGFAEFSRKFPNLVDSQGISGPNSLAKQTLSLSGPVGGGAAGNGLKDGGANGGPVVGGCPMPTSKSAANPFFGNIRQNMDLIGGVGQMNIKRPEKSLFTGDVENALPTWLSTAIDDKDAGKTVSDRFLEIEKTEQKVMMDAFSVNSVSYSKDAASGNNGSGDDDEVQKVTIAGIEKGAKNRYNNIFPYDHSRVRLQGCVGDECDYINASFVKARWSEKTYIATQAPIPSTFADFWRLVWEQDARLIVMLTAESEGGQIKSDPYWRTGEYGQFKLKNLAEKRVTLDHAPGGNLATAASARRAAQGQRRSTNPHTATERDVSTPHDSGTRTTVSTPIDSFPLGNTGSTPNSVAETPYITVRHVTLAHTSYPFLPMREITQIQYSHWPDFGTPAQPSHLLALIETCNEYARRSNHPHSSTPKQPSFGNKHLSPTGSGPSTNFNLSPVSPLQQVPLTPEGIPECLFPQPEGQYKVLVHCSAGCGRTGTFCTVDSVIDMIKRQEVERRRARTQIKTNQSVARMHLGSFSGDDSADLSNSASDSEYHLPDLMEIDSTPKKPRSSYNQTSSKSRQSSSTTSANTRPVIVSRTSSALSTLTTSSSSTGASEDDAWVYSSTDDLIANTVRDLRSQRLSMVQSLRQFVLCYESVLEWFVVNKRAGLLTSGGELDGTSSSAGVAESGSSGLKRLSSVRRSYQG